MANYEYITATGVIIPDTAQIKSEVEAEFKKIFGDDFVTDPETPEGDLIGAIVSERMSVVRNNAKLANQINPNLSGGIFLDAIMALTDSSRDGASNSNVEIVSTGVAGTVVRAGSRVESDAGDIWRSVSEFTIPTTGTVTATFKAEEFGPVAASPNTITKIKDEILGWETVKNTAAAVLGKNKESDPVARRKRKNTLALQGRSTAAAVRSNLADVEGVRSHSFRENITGSTRVIDGVTLVEHSIWVAVQGGRDEDVAMALLEAKSSGSDWNGKKSISVIDPESGQPYQVKFDRPTEVPISIKITARPPIGTTPRVEINKAIMDYAAGLLGEDGFVVDGDVSTIEIGAAVNSELGGNAIFIVSVEVAKGTGPNLSFSGGTLPIAVNEVATLSTSNITVAFV
ncbi:baseplate J/gp47 family protein [Vibrio harveyi]|uniref:baseplate J/gp47 family protein n=1 Tax=Vibrio harveyi TaxID=669 RepID=UPI00237D3301|nr:baseplate J/gp47 family protein [Vibrio harveyi]HDM8061710.1 baseplate J/gp47 family protein [Vibrio harveyi]